MFADERTEIEGSNGMISFDRFRLNIGLWPLNFQDLNGKRIGGNFYELI